jgi:tetratricopeptide (TPR) repeat protein
MDTHDASLDEVHRLLQSGYPAAAWELLGQRPSTTATNWEVLYLAGQCRRFLDDYSGAIALLSRSAALAPRVAPVLLALGIAYQLDERFDEAKKALALAIEVDPDYALAFNSLAMTQKLTGEWDKSVHNYDAGCKALARAIVKGMQNRPDSLEAIS